MSCNSQGQKYDLRHVQPECMQIDDDTGWLVVFVLDTGMRLDEATGLSVDDFNLHGDFHSKKSAVILWLA